ncbi:MAG: hypothetical protein AB8C13_05580 [Phycisphaerales bacterium]
MTENTVLECQLVGEIRADRACVGCGFNLFGQSIIKEEHYGLGICRCPECGTVAALQSYPVMSHWVNRFRMLIAAVWIIVLTVVFIGHTLTAAGMAQASSGLAGQHLSDIIGQSHHEWTQQQNPDKQLVSPSTVTTNVTNALTPTLAPGTTIQTTNGVTTVNGVVVPPPGAAIEQSGQYDWVWLTAGWGDEHLDQLIEMHGGLWANIDKKFVLMLIPGTVIGVLFGIFWSVALLGSTRRRAMTIPLLAGVIAFVFIYAITRDSLSNTYVSKLAESLYVPIVGLMYLAYICLVSFFGIWIGRKVARVVVVMALQPRSRVPFSPLWTRDGLSLPKPT